jgi:hypothetical protein
MKTRKTTPAPKVGSSALVRLARKLKAISGHDVGVTLKQARAMSAEELAEKIREFGSWHKNHCEAISQQVEQAIFYALDDEANDERRHGPENQSKAPKP